MSVALAPPAFVEFAGDYGMSSTARDVEIAIDETEDLQSSLVLSERDTLYLRFAERAATFSRAPTEGAVKSALRLIAQLPEFVPAPDFEIEPDGQISFDWQVDKDHALSFNMGQNGLLGYSYLNGVEYGFGRVPFADALPRPIGELFVLLFAESPTHSR